MSMLMRILFLGLMIYLGLVLMMAVFHPRLVFLPDVAGRDLVATPERIGVPFESISLATPDGETLHGWWLPHPEPRATLLFQHGNAGNISHRLDSLEIFRQLGLSVLIYDYRGYGLSTGRPSEAGVYIDARRAWDYLVEEIGIAPDEIILFGRSMGGAIAAQLATVAEPRGLIIESSFTSVPDIGAEAYPWLPVRWLTRIHFPTLDHVADSRAPVLVVHSPDDEIIPFHHGQRIYEAAPEPKQMLEIQGDHNTGFIRSGALYLEGLDRFISSLR
ncbi:MAG: alpha/beta hydrolase [Wenzhouxiangella sp.]